MTVDPAALRARAASLLAPPAGDEVLGRAVRAVLGRDGAPTRPGGPTGPLADRVRAGEPLAEDTDRHSPLGPFRDPHVQAGTLGELCAARLRSGGFAGDLLLALLARTLRDGAGDLLGGALDDADADAACRAAVADLLGGDLRTRPLVPLATAPAGAGSPLGAPAVPPAATADR